MANLQWLGSIPGKHASLVDAIHEASQASERRALIRKEEERYQQQQKIDLSKIDYDKKRDAANMVITVAKQLTPEKAAAFLEDEQIKTLFSDLGWPLPTDLAVEPDYESAARAAVAKGETLPGLTKEQTEKAAGVYIPESKVTSTDIKGARSEVPWWEYVIPGRQTQAYRDYEALLNRRRNQLIGEEGYNPLNVQGR